MMRGSAHCAGCVAGQRFMDGTMYREAEMGTDHGQRS
jgi:hypothetical protein